jgi:hypothetical protein
MAPWTTESAWLSRTTLSGATSSAGHTGSPPHGTTGLWVSRQPSPQFYPGAVTLQRKVSPEQLINELRACCLVEVLPEALLRDQSVRVLQRKRANDVSAGAVLNRTGSVVGLSNVFSLNVALDEVWGDLVVLAAQEFPSCPIVGYARAEALDAAIGTGFNDLAGLMVWLQRQPSGRLWQRRLRSDGESPDASLVQPDRLGKARTGRAFRTSSRCDPRVGETGFEPATARPPAGCATRLRHSP